MPTISQTPAYNLKAVLKETHLTADTLRVWERRYDLPRPHRTSGGHRLYSQYDIETIKWLQARQAEGLSISRAVELWKERLAAGQDPLLDHEPPEAAAELDSVSAVDTRLENLRRYWLDAVLAFDEKRAEEALNLAFSIYPVETVCTFILQQGLSQLGDDWYLGRATVQQEHFASALATRRLETLITATPHPTRQKTVLVGCPPGEWHHFSALLLCLLLRRRGVEVVYLGSNLPLEQLDETAAAIQPDLIVLVAHQLATAASLQSAARLLQARGVPVGYGGLIFTRLPKLRQHIAAHFLGESLGEGLQQIKHLLTTPLSALPPVPDSDNRGHELARLYRVNRLLVEVTLYQNLQSFGLPSEYILEANTFFGDELQAALELGDPTLLEPDLEWVQCLLMGHDIPTGRLGSYLAAYGQALARVLGEASAPVTAWIDTVRDRY